MELNVEQLVQVSGGAGAGSVITLQLLIQTVRVYPGTSTINSWIGQTKAYARQQLDLLVPPYLHQRYPQYTEEEIRQTAYPYWMQVINSVL